MGWLDRLLHGRKQLLNSPEPERAFAPDPSADYWPLEPNRTNDEAYKFIREHGIALIQTSTGSSADLSEFKGGLLLFATRWEPYSARSMGALKQGVDARRIDKFGIVFFQDTWHEVTENKSDAWYFQNAWTLAEESAALGLLIARVPFQVFVGADANVTRIVEGKM
jgi:hypothetical protein